MVCDALGAELRAAPSHTAADHIRGYSVRSTSSEPPWAAILLLRADHTPCKTKIMPAIAAQFGLGGDVVITPVGGGDGGEDTDTAGSLLDCGRVLVDAALGYGDRPDTSGKTLVYDDLRNAEEGEGCACEGNPPLKAQRGLEVGHTFLLGTKYSETFGTTFVNQQQEEALAVMGCYGWVFSTRA